MKLKQFNEVAKQLQIFYTTICTCALNCPNNIPKYV